MVSSGLRLRSSSSPSALVSTTSSVIRPRANSGNDSGEIYLASDIAAEGRDVDAQRSHHAAVFGDSDRIGIAPKLLPSPVPQTLRADSPADQDAFLQQQGGAGLLVPEPGLKLSEQVHVGLAHLSTCHPPCQLRFTEVARTHTTICPRHHRTAPERDSAYRPRLSGGLAESR